MIPIGLSSSCCSGFYLRSHRTARTQILVVTLSGLKKSEQVRFVPHPARASFNQARRRLRGFIPCMVQRAELPPLLGTAAREYRPCSHSLRLKGLWPAPNCSELLYMMCASAGTHSCTRLHPAPYRHHPVYPLSWAPLRENTAPAVTRYALKGSGPLQTAQNCST